MKRILLSATALFIAVLLSVTLNTRAQSNWTKLPANPVLSPGTGWLSYGFPFIYLLNIDDTLRMWFTASDGNPVSFDRMGYATSTDGLNFTISDDPVFEPSSGSTFDSQGVFGACVLYDDTIYRMWYNGYNTQPYYTGHLRTGLATSADGKTWVRNSPDPVLELGPAGSWDDVWAYVNTVIYENGMYKMWYTGYDGQINRIGLATSTDGITWTKYANNPIIEAGGAGSLSAAQNARVIHDESGYKMWFNGQHSNVYYNVYYATSSDGVFWNYNITPVLHTGPSGSFDDLWAWSPCIIKQNNVYRMWYTGYDGTTYSVGYASDSTSLSIEETEHNSKLTSVLLSLSPNPATSNFQIAYSLSRTSDVKLRIVNALGQEVKNINDFDPGIGLHSRDINIHELTFGTYYVQLYGCCINSIKKLIIYK